MTVYTQNLAVSQYGIQYAGSVTEVQDLAVGDSITASFDQEATSNQQTSLLDVEDNDIVFTLVNCTISPTNVKNRGTFTITPTSSGAAYSCVGVLIYYSPSGQSYGGPSTDHQQTTFTISGFYGVAPRMGLQLYNPSGDLRLDTSDRQVRAHSFYMGSFYSGGSATVTGITGFDPNDETWAIDVLPISLYISFTASAGQFTITRSSADPFTLEAFWKVILFRV